MERVFKNSHYNGVYVLLVSYHYGFCFIKIHVVLHFGCWGLIKFIAKDMHEVLYEFNLHCSLM